MDRQEWNERIDAFLEQENRKAGAVYPVHRIYCQDDSDRSGGGIYNETVTVDTIGRYARALGDTNPLFSDPRYAGQSRYGGIIAPPLIECCICSTFIGGSLPRLRGLTVFDAGTRWERFLPIRPGDVFSGTTTYMGVEDLTKPGAGSRLLRRSNRIDLRNQKGELVSRLTARSLIRCADPDEIREKSPKSPDSPACGRPRYTEEELERVYENLDAQFRGLWRRGGQPRYWEDVEIGEELAEEIAGPYDESDGHSLMAAIGASNAFATKWNTIRRGRGFIDPETGARRHPIDRHSSDSFARSQGLPRALVYGIHSQALLARSVSDWMGDDGLLRTLDCRCLKPLYYGDLSLQRGRVTAKYEENGEGFAVLKMEAARQDGVVHTDAEAVVRLPRRS